MEEKQAHDLALLQLVFGKDFLVLPTIKLLNSNELANSFAASNILQGNDPLAAVSWFQRVARVREAVARLERVLLYAEALGGDALRFQVGQLPFKQNDRWIGLPTFNKPLAGGLISLVAHMTSEIDFHRSLAGLFIDEWVEAVPNASEITGVAFHFDGPGARAPQSILLAVSPNDQQTWDLDTLEAILLETIELVKFRAVDPDALGEVGHFLPALYFALNVAGDTISTDFTRLATPPANPPEKG
jgi:hypothetical protein